MASVESTEEALRRLDLRLDRELGCIFCASCADCVYPINPSMSAYCLHRKTHHDQEFWQIKRKDAASLIRSLSLTELQHKRLQPDGSLPLEGLPIFQEFKCMSCDFETLYLDVARRHQHETTMAYWQSYIQSKSGFKRHSWTVASGASRQQKDGTNVEGLLDPHTAIDGDQPAIASTDREDKLNTAGSIALGGLTDIKTDCQTDPTMPEKPLVIDLLRVQSKGLNECDVVLTLMDFVKEHGQDAPIHVVATWFYKTLRDGGIKAAMTEAKATDLVGYEYVLFPVFDDDRWFLLVVCTRIGRFLCFDPLHQMHYKSVSLLVEYFRSCLTYAFGAIICPKTTPYVQSADDSGALVLGVAKKFLENPMAAVQAAVAEDARFAWDIDLATIRRQLVYRIAPLFYDAYTATETIKCAVAALNQQANNPKLSQAIDKLGMHFRNLADCVESLEKRLSSMRVAYADEYEKLEKLLSLKLLSPSFNNLQKRMSDENVDQHAIPHTPKSHQVTHQELPAVHLSNMTQDVLYSSGASRSQNPGTPRPPQAPTLSLRSISTVVGAPVAPTPEEKSAIQTGQVVSKRHHFESGDGVKRKVKRHRSDKVGSMKSTSIESPDVNTQSLLDGASNQCTKTQEEDKKSRSRHKKSTAKSFKPAQTRLPPQVQTPVLLPPHIVYPPTPISISLSSDATLSTRKKKSKSKKSKKSSGRSKAKAASVLVGSLSQKPVVKMEEV